MTHCCHSHDDTVVFRCVVVIRLPVCKKRATLVYILMSKDRITMWRVAALCVVVLFSTNRADGMSRCDSDAPDNCTFEGELTSCNWTLPPNVWTYGNSSAVFGTDGSLEANMTSRTACSTERNTHCLNIRYMFHGKNSTVLNVSHVKRNDNDKTLVWSSGDQVLDTWHTANVPITNNHPFYIILEGRRYYVDGAKIEIDYIEYVKSPCPASQTNATTPAEGTVTVTEKTTTSITGPDASTQASTSKTVSTERTTIGSRASTDASEGNSKAGSNDVGAVVGAVVAVVVIAVAVGIFILYRRKRLHLWKTCFRNENKNNTAASGQSQNGERTVGRNDKRTVNSVNSTPTVSGYENHPFTLTGPQSSVSYYNVIKDADEAGDSAAPQYSNMHGSQSADCSKVPSDLTFADIDPYEIKAENGNLPSVATSNTKPITNPKGKARQYQNYPVPACSRDKSQATSDYSLARATGGEATGVYDNPEEDPRNPREGEEAALYQYAKDPDVNGERHADATGVYHILERDSSGSQPFSAYHAPKGGNVGQQHTPTVNVSKGQTGNYNTLDFAGKSSGQKNDGDDSGGVYNHLNAESDDPYNEVDREKRAEVIDDEYSHIK